MGLVDHAPSTRTAPWIAARAADRIGSSRIRELLELVDRPDVRSLAGGLPDVSLLDPVRVREASDAAMAVAGPLGATALQYGPTAGVRALREVIGRRLGVSGDAVAVTTGSQQGLDLLARTVCAPGDAVVMEDPGYLGAIQAFSAAGADLVGVGGDGNGMCVDQVEDLFRTGLRPGAIYVVADHHNPTGTVLSTERRVRLVELADRFGVVIIEDAAYHELRWGPSVDPLFSPGGPVVHVGSSSKILAPGLRVGWLTGPAHLMEGALRLKQAADLHTPTWNQLVVANLLTDGRQDQHLERVRHEYGARSLELVDSLRTRLGDRVSVDLPDGGMFVWLTAADGTDTDRLFDTAIAHGVAFVPGSAFALAAGPTTTARLSFATLSPDHLDDAVTRLAAAWPS